jgi:hypothetical protein
MKGLYSTKTHDPCHGMDMVMISAAGITLGRGNPGLRPSLCPQITPAAEMKRSHGLLSAEFHLKIGKILKAFHVFVKFNIMSSAFAADTTEDRCGNTAEGPAYNIL